MRHRLNVAAVLLALGLCLGAANASAGFLDIFRPDLKFDLMVDRTEGLKVGDAVEFQNETGQRQVIGRIDAVPDARGGQPLVKIRIQSRHKDQVRAGSRVVVDRPWLGERTVRIYIVTPMDQAASEPLRSGAVVQSRSAVADKTARMADRVQALMETFLERSREYLDHLRSEVDQGHFDQFMDRLKDTARAVTRYTREQKDRFTREILPELERMMESARKHFQETHDPRKGEELEKAYKRLKEELAV